MKKRLAHIHLRSTQWDRLIILVFAIFMSSISAAQIETRSSNSGDFSYTSELKKVTFYQPSGLSDHFKWIVIRER